MEICCNTCIYRECEQISGCHVNHGKCLYEIIPNDYISQYQKLGWVKYDPYFSYSNWKPIHHLPEDLFEFEIE